MKKLSLLIFIFSTLLLTSCGQVRKQRTGGILQNVSELSAVQVEQMIAGGSSKAWGISSAEVNYANGTKENIDSASMAVCSRDDVILLNSNRSGSTIHNQLCGNENVTSSVTTGSWVIRRENNKTYLVLTSGEDEDVTQIMQVSETVLVLAVFSTDSTISHTIQTYNLIIR